MITRITNATGLKSTASLHHSRFVSAMFVLAALTSCGLERSATDRNWHDETIYVQLGDVTFKLVPGRVYSLEGMKDREINAALQEGKGSRKTPILLRSLRIGVKEKDGKLLDYDVDLFAPPTDAHARNATSLPAPLSEISSVEFIQNATGLTDGDFEGEAKLRFLTGHSVNVPVDCSAIMRADRIINGSCYLGSMRYRDLKFTIRGRNGSADHIAEDFQEGLKLVSNIEQN